MTSRISFNVIQHQMCVCGSADVAAMSVHG